MEATWKGKKGEDSQLKGDIKPPFVIAKDDTKPVLQDPLWRSEPTQAEEAVLRLPPFPLAGAAPK